MTKEKRERHLLAKSIDMSWECEYVPLEQYDSQITIRRITQGYDHTPNF